MPPATSQDGATPYTLHEAAQLLGVSLNTVRRKITRGELKATQVPRPQGHVWHVWLERTQDAAQHPTQGSTQHPPEGSAQHPANGYVQEAAGMLPAERADQLTRALVPLVEAAVAPLRAELADVRALLSARDQELGAALERIRALEVPREPPSSRRPFLRDSEEVAVDPVQAPAASRNGRPWWRFWHA